MEFSCGRTLTLIRTVKKNSGLTTTLSEALPLRRKPPSTMTEARARSFLDRTTALPSEVNASRTPPAYASGIIWVVQVATAQDVVTSPCQNGFHQLMNPSHHEPGNNVVSRNS